MTLWLYAILPGAAGESGEGGAGGGSDLGAGLAGERLEILQVGALRVAAGRVAAPPAAAEASLRAHDAVVRRLLDLAGSLLPVRFGQTVPDAEALAELLAPRRPALARALAEVAGCRQMTLRVLRDVSAETCWDAGTGESKGSDVSAETSDARSGTRYLAERREAERRRRSLPEIAPLLAELAPLVRAERIERGGPAPLVGSAYHLVPAERTADWVARLESATPALAAGGPRLAWSGPFPPWAFAPELA